MAGFIDIYGFVKPRTSKLKSGTFLPSTKRNDDVSKMGRFTRNKLQWNKNDIKVVKPPMETTYQLILPDPEVDIYE